MTQVSLNRLIICAVPSPLGESEDAEHFLPHDGLYGSVVLKSSCLSPLVGVSMQVGGTLVHPHPLMRAFRVCARFIKFFVVVDRRCEVLSK